MKGDDELVSQCLRCKEFKEREEMESRTTEEYPVVAMCIDCWKRVDYDIWLSTLKEGSQVIVSFTNMPSRQQSIVLSVTSLGIKVKGISTPFVDGVSRGSEKWYRLVGLYSVCYTYFRGSCGM